MPTFNTASEYVAYLRETLIPDLRDSGSEATADDFDEAVHWLQYTIGVAVAVVAVAGAAAQSDGVDERTVAAPS